MKERKPILCLDFDGVCHLYKSPWAGPVVIPDDAVPGLFEFLEAAAPYFDIQVFSTRSKYPIGRDAMALWFVEQRQKWRAAGGQGQEVLEIKFPEEKPPFFVALDDRVLTFTGVWPDIQALRNFKPWNRQPWTASIQPASPRSGAELIAAERQRQIEEKGYTPGHDDRWTDGQLLNAALCYANHAILFDLEDSHLRRTLTSFFRAMWPWDPEWYKPETPIADLVRAGALIAAEIDRRRRVIKPEEV